MTNRTHGEPDSVILLSDELTAFRAKMVSYMMIPAPASLGLNLDEVASLFSENLYNACKDFWDLGTQLTEVNADILHQESWKDLVVTAEGKQSTVPDHLSTNISRNNYNAKT